MKRLLSTKVPQIRTEIFAQQAEESPDHVRPLPIQEVGGPVVYEMDGIGFMLANVRQVEADLGASLAQIRTIVTEVDEQATEGLSTIAEECQERLDHAAIAALYGHLDVAQSWVLDALYFFRDEMRSYDSAMRSKLFAAADKLDQTQGGEA